MRASRKVAFTPQQLTVVYGVLRTFDATPGELERTLPNQHDRTAFRGALAALAGEINTREND